MNKEFQAEPAQGSIDTAEFQRLAHDYRRHQTDADYTALVAHIDAHIAQRASSGDVEPVYQIANDSKPSGWSDVAKEEFDIHLVTTWRKKRILYAAPAPIADEALIHGELPVVREFQEWLNDQRMRNVSEAFHEIVTRFRKLATAAPAGHAEPVARLHIRLEEDGLTCDIEVLNGENLQVEHSPVDVYLAAPVAAEPANQNAAVAVIQYVLELHDGSEMDFLRLWNEGEFDKCRDDWPEAPEAVYIGADPLHPLTQRK